MTEHWCGGRWEAPLTGPLPDPMLTAIFYGEEGG